MRNRTVLVALALLGVGALAAVSCNSITGLNDYEAVECFEGCTDGGIDSALPDVVDADVARPDADAGPEADAPEPDVDVPDVIVEVGPDVGFDVNLDAEAGLLDPKRRWARWRMPHVENTDAGALPPGVTTADYEGGDGGSPALVHDKITDLRWDEDASAPLTYANAVSYCSGRPPLTGFAWSLPTRIELVSLLDYSRPEMIDSTVFDVQNAEFWTRSPNAGAQGEVWVVSFFNGTVKPAVSLSSDTRRARCVLIRK